MRSVVAGVKLTKESAYGELAIYVNQRCGTNWDKKQAESRYKAYLKCFKETKRKYLNPCGEKYCISEADRAKKITTIEDKLNADCPYYARMDQLFGERQNVQPSYIMEPGIIVTPSGCNVNGEDDELSIVEGEESEDEAENRSNSGSQDQISSVSSDFSPVMTPTPAVAAAPPKPAEPKKRPLVTHMPDDLVSKCAASAASNEDKVSVLKRQKKDLVSSYTEAKSKELDLLSSRLEWEKTTAETDLKLKEADLKLKEAELRLKESLALKDIDAVTKRALMVSLVTAGKSPEEIQNYFAMLL
jgi:hypothetical protein